MSAPNKKPKQSPVSTLTTVDLGKTLFIPFVKDATELFNKPTDQITDTEIVTFIEKYHRPLRTRFTMLPALTDGKLILYPDETILHRKEPLLGMIQDQMRHFQRILAEG